jgi:predicted nucleic acid-binding protein
MFVLDASAILSWCFEDERPRNADALMRRFVGAGMIAPSHWPLEVTNILWVGERAKRISAPQVSAFVALVEALRVEIDMETPWRAWSETRELARREQVTTYDAAYLELAIRRQATLVSKDKKLIAAARANTAQVLDLGVPR